VLTVGMTGQVGSPLATALLLAAATGLVWLSFRIDAASDHRLFPTAALSLFAPVGLAYWVYFLISLTHTCLLIFAPLFLGVLHGMSPLWVGYLALVFSIGWTVGSVAVSGWSGGRERIATVGGMILAAASIVVFAIATVGGPLMLVTISITVCGLGIGMSNVQMTAFGMSAARKGEESVTASAMQTVRSLGIAFGAAIAGLVANAAGLDRDIGAPTVANVALWVLGMTVAAPMIAALCAWRAHALAARRSEPPPR